LRLFPAFLLFTLLFPFDVSSQERPKSPVFKDYEPPESHRIVRRSTATYKLWEIFMLNRSANAGDPLAQHELGLRYLTGEGVTPDTVRAAYWIQLASEQLVIPARFNLGILSYYGWGVAWDPFAAFRLFLYAANQNMREAQYILGQFYSDNLVVPQNYDEARLWLTKASESGYEPAERMLEKLEERREERRAETAGVDSASLSVADTSFSPLFLDFEEDSVVSDPGAPWLKEVLQEGGNQLRYAFGGAYETEEGVRVDSISLRTIRESAEAGSPEALVLLGRMYERGIQLEADEIKAGWCYFSGMRLGSVQGYQALRDMLSRPGFSSLLRTGADSETPEAMLLWAGLHALGFDVLADDPQSRLTDAQALRFVERAAESGLTDAMVELGLCYFSGRWVEADRDRGVSYWRQAAALGDLEGAIREAMIIVRTEGDPVRLDEAIATLKMGSAVGSILAEVGIAYCYETGTRMKHSKGTAAGIYRRAAYRGSRDAYYALQRMHDEIRPSGTDFRIEETD
jgi:TPR repeat protein